MRYRELRKRLKGEYGTGRWLAWFRAKTKAKPAAGIRIYGNVLPPDAPPELWLGPEGLAQLYAEVESTATREPTGETPPLTEEGR